MMPFVRLLFLLIGLSLSCHSIAAEKVTLALNWKAQPELGGFYQALAEGLYAAEGLDVTIRPGGPMVNNRPLLAIGRVDFLVGTNLLQAFDAVKQKIPTKVVAAMLQKDPQCMIAHPNQGYEQWSDLTRAPLLIANPGRHSFFLWMEAEHGFQRRMLRPYNHSLAPFLMNKASVQQGYATAEPKRVEEELGQDPKVFLLADHGWNSYSTVIEARDEMIESQPSIVQAFVDASIRGWYGYLYGDHTKADALIKESNPSMTDAQITYSIEKMRSWGLVDSGDSIESGIGVLRGERVRDFYQKMTNTGLYRPDEINPDDCYTTRYIDQGVGLELRPENSN